MCRCPWIPPRGGSFSQGSQRFERGHHGLNDSETKAPNKFLWRHLNSEKKDNMWFPVLVNHLVNLSQLSPGDLELHRPTRPKHPRSPLGPTTAPTGPTGPSHLPGEMTVPTSLRWMCPSVGSRSGRLDEGFVEVNSPQRFRSVLSGFAGWQFCGIGFRKQSQPKYLSWGACSPKLPLVSLNLSHTVQTSYIVSPSWLLHVTR